MELADRVEILEQKVSSLETLPAQVDSLRMEFLQFRTDTSDGFSSMQEEMHVLHRIALNRMDKLHGIAIGEIRAVRTSVTREMADVRGQVQDLRSEVRELRDEVRLLSGRQQQLEGRVDRLSAQVDEIRGQVEELRGQVEELRGQVEELRGQVEELRGQVEELRGQVQEMGGQFQELRGQVQEMGGQFQEMRNDVRAFHTDIVARLTLLGEQIQAGNHMRASRKPEPRRSKR